MGAVSILQYFYRVSHVAVQEVHPEACLDICPYLETFYWKFHHPCRSQELNAVSCGIKGAQT